MAKYILSDIFQGNFSVTQKYGNNPTYYKQFGFNGHEGVDWGMPNGTPILAPFDGVIVRDIDDSKVNAYGIHVVVWDPVQKCAVWFCHLQSNSVSNGDKVKKGQVIGLSNNTGNTTGPHLHANFCETDATGNRINTDNGYKGFLNILDSNLVEWKLGETTKPSDPIVTASFVDLTNFETALTKNGTEQYGIVSIDTLKSKLIAKDQYIASHPDTPQTSLQEPTEGSTSAIDTFNFIQWLKGALGLTGK